MKSFVLTATWSMEQIVAMQRNVEQTAPLDLFLAGMSSVMVTISTCADGIPTVVIKSISVRLRGAEFPSCSSSNSLFVDYWQHAGTCQQHVGETSPLSVESQHNAWCFPLCVSRAASEWPSGDSSELSVDKGFPDSPNVSGSQVTIRSCEVQTSAADDELVPEIFYTDLCRRTEGSWSGNVETDRMNTQPEKRGFLVQTCCNSSHWRITDDLSALPWCHDEPMAVSGVSGVCVSVPKCMCIMDFSHLIIRDLSTVCVMSRV